MGKGQAPLHAAGTKEIHALVELPEGHRHIKNDL
jgi:hypothetical protein